MVKSQKDHRSSSSREGGKFSLTTVLFLCLVCFFLRDLFATGGNNPSSYLESNMEYLSTVADGIYSGGSGSSSLSGGSSDYNEDSLSNPLAIPRGKAIAMPSVRIDDNNAEYDRAIYGGKGDKPHLGGFTEFDPDGVSPAVWKWMIEYLGIKSLLDIGCGRGTSTTWFQIHGVDATCVEGSHDAIEQSRVADKSLVTEHDFSRGPWWPETTVDAVWTVELLEHIGRNFHKNLFPAMRKAGIVFASFSSWGGWHHVEVHDEDWWIYKFEAMGFKHSPELTKKVRQIAMANGTPTPIKDGTYRAQHIWLHMLVFINPAVTALPKHHHLFAEPGCFVRRTEEGENIKRNCGEGTTDKATVAVESPIPKSFLPLQLEKSMDDEWERLVFGKTLEEFQKENPPEENPQ